MLKLGHFAALRWTTSTEQTDAEDGKALAEVFVGGEALAREPVEILGTLLHEAAHALADVRGIKDTSRPGRRYNAKFKALAEELRIEVAKDERTGWSPTNTPTATREPYVEFIEQLGCALCLRRAAELGYGEGPKKKPARPACVCGCGRRFRVAPSVLELGPTDAERATTSSSPSPMAPLTRTRPDRRSRRELPGSRRVQGGGEATTRRPQRRGSLPTSPSDVGIVQAALHERRSTALLQLGAHVEVGENPASPVNHAIDAMRLATNPLRGAVIDLSDALRHGQSCACRLTLAP